ncbi:4-amino-4-deoxy-L-arabinose-phosphoundecaprenol flippase subunit ArnF [Paraferrimonas sp. SM1919]|uniref:4-amino-4-deoxy-L-arabinose-phosphoundecaprenol flippase subunit ArnF n=1 Tax=Paraferrimonas sp. SM1919 TaxID=2662263 RepID=UPI0013D3F28B|nr:4-amino-4-deoxy-L-arabinose-phosphoundecaprenol flippase subunit ArnF [Paraferrimonas sp. SM1919]
MKLNSGLLYALASVALVSFAQLAMKYGMSNINSDYAWLFEMQQWIQQWPSIIWVISGLIAYVASMACWLGALSYLPLSRAYPILALSYVVVYFAANLLDPITETIELSSLLGIVMIVLGVSVVNSGKTH